MDTPALPSGDLGSGEADPPRKSHCEYGGEGSDAGAMSKCFTHENSLKPHNNCEGAPSSSPCYRCRNRCPALRSNLPGHTPGRGGAHSHTRPVATPTCVSDNSQQAPSSSDRQARGHVVLSLISPSPLPCPPKQPVSPRLFLHIFCPKNSWEAEIQSDQRSPEGSRGRDRT